MNEEREQQLRELKLAVTERLATADIGRYRLRSVDRRLESYIKAVVRDPDGLNLWEQLAVERFMTMTDRYGINVGAVRAFFTFYESLLFSTPEGRKRYKLTPVQCFQFASIFGFWHQGRRVVREACLFVPRKFSKTTSTASLAVWDLIYGDANAECYIGANSSKQAKKCFNVIRESVRSLDPRGRRFVVNKEEISTNSSSRTAFAQCLTANARTKDGLNASTIIMDEYSQAREATLYTVLTTSTGARANPLTVIITTASDVYDGPFYNKLMGYKKILTGEAEDDSVFAHLFEPDVGDDESVESTWRKVHPHIGVTVPIEYYRAKWIEAQRDGAEAMLAFRTKLLNIYAQNTSRQWITRAVAEAATRSMSAATTPDGLVAAIAIDMSRVDDLTAVTTALYDTRTAHLRLITDYFFPSGAIDGHVDADLLRRWAADGHLHLIDGPTIDYRPLALHISEVMRRYRVIKIAYDSYGMTDLANQLRGYGWGSILFPIPQTHGYFHGPVNFLEKGLKDGAVTINDNPINLFCFSNCVLVENAEGFKPFKKNHASKIDGAIAMLMASRCFLYWER